jgi:hypothetical protein
LDDEPSVLVVQPNGEVLELNGDLPLFAGLPLLMAIRTAISFWLMNSERSAEIVPRCNPEHQELPWQ